MPTKKIADCPVINICRHPDHNPPSMRLFEPGVYEHVCSGCGKRSVFRVHGHTLSRWTGGTTARWEATA